MIAVCSACYNNCGIKFLLPKKRSAAEVLKPVNAAESAPKNRATLTAITT